MTRTLTLFCEKKIFGKNEGANKNGRQDLDRGATKKHRETLRQFNNRIWRKFKQAFGDYELDERGGFT